MSVQYVTTEQTAKFSAARDFTSISNNIINIRNYSFMSRSKDRLLGCAAAQLEPAALAERCVH
jgi:hypothetical protein